LSKRIRRRARTAASASARARFTCLEGGDLHHLRAPSCPERREREQASTPPAPDYRERQQPRTASRPKCREGDHTSAAFGLQALCETQARDPLADGLLVFFSLFLLIAIVFEAQHLQRLVFFLRVQVERFFLVVLLFPPNPSVLWVPLPHPPIRRAPLNRPLPRVP
jgi:hypothetical protein